MSRGLLFFILLFCSQLHAQITASSTQFSFGDLYSGSQTYTDINFTNTTSKVQWLLTIDKPRDVYYIFSAKQIQPGESITIRFKINDTQKGKFSYNVDVYFSEPKDPITINLTGNVKEMSQESSLTACPDFNAAPPDNANEFDMAVRVIDSLTREPIPGAKVYLVQNGQLIGNFTTNNKGIVKRRLDIGYYYITAEHAPYSSNYFEGYLNFRRNYVEIELNYTEHPPVIEEPMVEEPVVENPVVETPPVDEVIDIAVVEQPVAEEPVVEEPTVETPVVEETPVTPVKLEELPDTVFNPAYFKFNNITFILDVSSSMNGMGKMDLLKMSMIELTKILRKEDIVSMIKFSSEVDIILDGASGDKKEEIIGTVKGLKTSAATAGGDAINEAYRVSRKNYIPGGNNMVIMITDGVFNKGDKNYLETIKKNYKSQGIEFCVVGIKTSDYVTTHMKDITSKGGGEFIRIITVEDAMRKLIDEIKRSSFKF